MRKPLTAIEIITIVLTLLVVGWFFFKILQPGRTSRAGQGNSEFTADTDLPAAGAAGFAKNDTAGHDAARDKGKERKPAGKLVLPAGTTLKVPPFLQEILVGADPEEAWLLESGMKLLEEGDYEEARRIFRSIMEDRPDSTLRAPANWALAHSYYLEGGHDNTALSAGRFGDFLSRFGSYKPEILVEAARIDLAIICMDLMRSGVTEQERVDAATVAFNSLQEFLNRWPDNPQAAAARASLQQVQDFLASRKKPGPGIR